MEDDTLKVARLRMSDEVLDRLRGLNWEQPHVDVAKGGMDGCGGGEGGV